MPRRPPVGCHSHCDYPPDCAGGRAAAFTIPGWDITSAELDLNGSALVLMQLPDAGLGSELARSPDCLRPDLLGSMEWVPRIMDLVTHQVPPLVGAARKARFQIVHASGCNWDAREYPQRWQCVAEVGLSPAPQLDPLSQGDWHSARFNRDFRPAERPPTSLDEEKHLFPRDVDPGESDLICSQTWELHCPLVACGIISLIHSRRALHWCLWLSECGMSNMQRLWYRLFAVPGACLGRDQVCQSSPVRGQPGMRLLNDRR